MAEFIINRMNMIFTIAVLVILNSLVLADMAFIIECARLGELICYGNSILLVRPFAIIIEWLMDFSAAITGMKLTFFAQALATFLLLNATALFFCMVILRISALFWPGHGIGPQEAEANRD